MPLLRTPASGGPYTALLRTRSPPLSPPSRVQRTLRGSWRALVDACVGPGGEQPVSESDNLSPKIFNIVSPSGNLISLDLPRGREVLAGALPRAGDVVAAERDPGSSPSPAGTSLALGAWLGGQSSLSSVAFCVGRLFAPRTTAWCFLSTGKEDVLRVLTGKEVGGGGPCSSERTK